MFWYFKMTFFQRTNIRKSLGVPAASRPTSGGIIWYHMVPYGTIRYHRVPYGTIRYHMVPYGTIWYHKVPYGTIWYHMVPRPGWGETLLGRQKFFGFLIFEKEVIFLISKNQTNRQNSLNIKELWPFDVWKIIPMKFRSFRSKNHWKRIILSRVMILFGFKLKIWYHKGTLWYHKVPYGTISYLMVP